MPIQPCWKYRILSMAWLAMVARDWWLGIRSSIREYHPLKRRHTTLVNLSAHPYSNPKRSRGIFIALPPYAHMRPHSNDTLVLPFSPFPRSRSNDLQERSLHFGRDDGARITIYKHIRCTLRRINLFPHTVISSVARNLPCTTVKGRVWEEEQPKHLGNRWLNHRVRFCKIFYT